MVAIASIALAACVPRERLSKYAKIPGALISAPGMSIPVSTAVGVASALGLAARLGNRELVELVT